MNLIINTLFIFKVKYINLFVYRANFPRTFYDIKD